jgi:hypothetical protein
MASALHSGERNGDLGRVAIRASISDLLVTEKVFLDSGQNFENVSALWQNENPPLSIEEYIRGKLTNARRRMLLIRNAGVQKAVKTLSFFRIALPWSCCSSCRPYENPKDRRMPGFQMKRCPAPSFDPTELKFSAVRWREACRFCPSTIRSNDARAGDLGSGGASSPLPLFLPADVHPAARGEGMTSDRNLCCFYKKRGSSCRTLGSLEILCR